MAGIEIAKKSDLEGFTDKSYVDGKVDKKADSGHTHSYGDITDTPSIPDVSGLATKTELTDGLGEKSDSGHTHAYSEITGTPTIPDMSGLYTKAEVDDLISGLQVQIDELKTSEPDLEE